MYTHITKKLIFSTLIEVYYNGVYVASIHKHKPSLISNEYNYKVSYALSKPTRTFHKLSHAFWSITS